MVSLSWLLALIALILAIASNYSRRQLLLLSIAVVLVALALLFPLRLHACESKVYQGGTNSNGSYDLSHPQQAIDDASNSSCASEKILVQ